MSGDELISLKETYGPRGGRVELHVPRACLVGEQWSGLCGRSCVDCAYSNQVS